LTFWLPFAQMFTKPLAFKASMCSYEWIKSPSKITSLRVVNGTPATGTPESSTTGNQLEFPIPAGFDDYTQDDLNATEGFFRYLLTLEGRPTSTLAKQLIRDGIESAMP